MTFAKKDLEAFTFFLVLEDDDGFEEPPARYPGIAVVLVEEELVQVPIQRIPCVVAIHEIEIQAAPIPAHEGTRRGGREIPAAVEGDAESVEYASLEIADLDHIPARTRVCLVQHVVLVAVPLVVRIMADGKLRSVQIILVLRADHLGEKPPMLLVFEHHLPPRKRRFVEREVMAPDVLHFVPRRSFVYGRVRVDASRVDHMRAHFPRPFREGIRHILPPAHDA